MVRSERACRPVDGDTCRVLVPAALGLLAGCSSQPFVLLKTLRTSASHPKVSDFAGRPDIGSWQVLCIICVETLSCPNLILIRRPLRVFQMEQEVLEAILHSTCAHTGPGACLQRMSSASFDGYAHTAAAANSYVRTAANSERTNNRATGRSGQSCLRRILCALPRQPEWGRECASARWSTGEAGQAQRRARAVGLF